MKRFSSRQSLFPSRHFVGLKLFEVFLLYCYIILECQGAVVFTSHPSNQTIMEGQLAHFECAFEGADNLVPQWRVNTTVYFFTDIPTIYGFDYQDFSLTIENAPRSLNFTSFQCIVGITFSNTAYLIIFANSTNSSEKMTLDLQNATTDDHDSVVTLSMDRLQKNTTNLENNIDILFPNNTKNNFTTEVIVPVIVSSVPVLAIIVLAVCIVILCAAKRRKSKLTTVELDNHVEIDNNDAYGALEKYRRAIKVDKNPSYEVTTLSVPVASERCQSPPRA